MQACRAMQCSAEGVAPRALGGFGRTLDGHHAARAAGWWSSRPSHTWQSPGHHPMETHDVPHDRTAALLAAPRCAPRLSHTDRPCFYSARPTHRRMSGCLRLFRAGMCTWPPSAHHSLKHHSLSWPSVAQRDTWTRWLGTTSPQNSRVPCYLLLLHPVSRRPVS